MELNKIESLVVKYDKGNTSLSEEAQLRSYFSKKKHSTSFGTLQTTILLL